jgi:NADPH-dependent curcumin reductase CurA
MVAWWRNKNSNVYKSSYNLRAGRTERVVLSERHPAADSSQRRSGRRPVSEDFSLTRNKAWVIARPSLGRYSPDCFRMEEREIAPLQQEEVLLRTLLLSVDPTTRNWLKLDPKLTYLPLQVGDAMRGQVIGEVIESRSAQFAPGDLVLGMARWETYSATSAQLVSKIDSASGVPLDAHMAIFSHIGRAAVMGIVAVGAVKRTDTVVISAAAGATGSLAAQIATAYGGRVIGIAGGKEKCRMLLEDLGLDGAIDYKAEDVATALARECPNGVDLFFDNVGGRILDAVLMHLAIGARIVICGAISQYDLASPDEEYGCRNLPQLMFRRARMEGFVVPQSADRYDEFDGILQRLYVQGKLRHQAHIVEGFERAPEALSLVFSGENRGKVMVQVAERLDKTSGPVV